MVYFYKTIEGQLRQLEQAQEGCWISAVSPTEEEIGYLVETLGADQGFVRAALDEEESSRVEKEDDQTLIIVDTPVAEQEDEKTVLYSTMPVGVVIIPGYVITVCLRENPVIRELSAGLVKNLQTSMKTHFLLLFLFRIAGRFLQYLKQIDKISSSTEKLLHKSMRNKELIQLLGLEKSLVYFSTSLKANEVTLEKVYRGRIIKLYEEDEELLEDVLVEVKQAIEMCGIYSGILSGTMDAFASIISNNLNIVMKIMTSITIVMAIPNIIYSFYGMNVGDLPGSSMWVPLAVSATATLLVTIILVKKGMFR